MKGRKKRLGKNQHTNRTNVMNGRKKRFGKNQHTGGGRTAVSADNVSLPEGGGVGNPKDENKTHGNHSSLRSRRLALPSSRPGALLPCVPSPSCSLQPRFPDCPPFSLDFGHHVSLLRGAQALSCLRYLPRGDEPFCSFEDSPVPLCPPALLH